MKKKNLMKSLTALVLSVLMVLSLAACGAKPSDGGKDEDKDGYTVAIIKQMDHASLDEIADAIAARLDAIAQEQNVSIRYTITSGQGDQSVLKQLADQAVASNEVVAEHIRALVPELEKYGLTLVLETHGDHGSGKILKEIVDRVGSPRVGINYDTANALFYGNVDLGADLDASMDAIRYMHLKDKGGERTVWDFPALGKGWLDFPLVFDKLAKAGNDCPFSIEIEFTQAGAKDLAEINQAVKDSAEYLTAHGFVL